MSPDDPSDFPEDGRAEPPSGTAVPPSVLAQLLATEHWSLLASRTTTQSEVLTRINMFLTLVSAGLVSLALVGQATGFSGDFGLFSIAVLGIVSLVGLLTQVRVINAAMDDLMYVLAMNRLRAAYTDIDIGIAPYLMASHHDDFPGVRRTYYFLGNRSGTSQVLGSSMMFIIAVNSTLIGLLVSAVLGAARSPIALVVAVGAVGGVAFLALSTWHGGRRFHAFWRSYSPLRPGSAD